MIYLDSSVALAHLLVEDRVPPSALWAEPLVSGCLLGAHAQRPLHLASMDFLRAHDQAVCLGSYNERLLSAARRLGVEVYTL